MPFCDMALQQTSFLYDQAYNEAHTCSEHGSDHTVVCARLGLRMKAARLSNYPVKLNTAKMKIAALENFRRELRNRFVGLEHDGDAD